MPDCGPHPVEIEWRTNPLSAFDDLWNMYPNSVTCDKLPRPRKLMTRECALSIIVAEERWGRGCIRPELLAEAKRALKISAGDAYDRVESDEFNGRGA